MGKQSYQLAFITVNYNGWSDTRDLIRSISDAELTIEYVIIVIDNGSLNDEWKLLKAEFPFIHGLRSDQNLGFAGGNNLGLELIEADFYYFINNDTLLPKEANKQIENMISFLDTNPLVGGISPKIKYVDNPSIVQFAGCTPLSRITLRNHQIGYQEVDRGQFEEIKPIPYMHGAAMLVTAEVIEKIGPLPDFYFLYYEELDWCYSILKKYELFYYPYATILHKESASTGLDSPFKTYYLTRNRLIYASRNRMGVYRFLSISYLLLTYCFHICSFIVKGTFEHAKSTLKGMRSGVLWILTN